MFNKEFVVNEFLSLKLEGEHSIIYVAGERYYRCYASFLNIPIDEVKKGDEIETINDLKNKLDPVTEFTKHSSNLQTWYEHDYNTILLNRNISFPLLKKLVEVGDQNAKRVFKEEIYKRFTSGNLAVIRFLFMGAYYRFLGDEEILSLFFNIFTTFNKINDSDKNQVLFYMGWVTQKANLLDKNFHVILNKLDKIEERSRVLIFIELIELIRGTRLIDKYSSLIESRFQDYFKIFNELGSKQKYELFHNFFHAIDGLRLVEQNFTFLYEMFNKIDYSYDKYDIKYDTLSKFYFTVQDKNLFDKNLQMILKAFNKIDDDFIKKKPILESDLTYNEVHLKRADDIFNQKYQKSKRNALSSLLYTIEGKFPSEETYYMLFKTLGRIDAEYIADIFSQLLPGINLQYYFTEVQDIFDNLIYEHSKSDILYQLIGLIENSYWKTSLLKDNFTALLDMIESMDGEYNKIRALKALVSTVKNQNDKFNLIKARFSEYSEQLEEMLRGEHVIERYCASCNELMVPLEPKKVLITWYRCYYCPTCNKEYEVKVLLRWKDFLRIHSKDK